MLPRPLVFALLTVTLAVTGAPQLETWPNNDAGFSTFTEVVEAGHPRNLLARKGVRAIGARAELADGETGERGGSGRVGISGQPSVFTYYLGVVKPIHRVGFFTFNVDARANQDYEVRFANNGANPGKQPTFPEAADLTVGDKVIGPDRGGCHSWFEGKDGKPLAKADWVQFRIWRTYNLKAGHAARTTQAQGWTAGIELEIHGAKDDIIRIDPAELARRKAMREALKAIPRSPELIKTDNWWDSMVASREAVLAWETKIDRLLVAGSGVTFGGWYVLGPVKAGTPEAQKLAWTNRFDLKTSPIKGASWRPAPEIVDGESIDLVKTFSLKPGQVVFLARTAEVTGSFDRQKPYNLGVGLGDGMVRFPPYRSSKRCRGIAGPNQQTFDLQCGSGDYHVLVEAPVRADGSCPFWFMPQPATGKRNAGHANTRRSRRQGLFSRLRAEFPDALSQVQMDWEQWDETWLRFQRHGMSRRTYFLSDWTPGQPPEMLLGQYVDATARRIEQLREDLTVFEPAIREAVTPWLASFTKQNAPTTMLAARERYRALCAVQEAAKEARAIESAILAVADLRRTFGDDYAPGEAHAKALQASRLAMAAHWPALTADPNAALPTLLELRTKAQPARQKILLASPLLAFDKLLLVKGGPHFTSNWGGPNSLGGEIGYLSQPFTEGKWTAIHQGRVSDLDLNFDGSRILFSNGRQLSEVKADGTGLRAIASQDDPHVMHFDGCYLPNEQIMFVSTACEQAVPCTGGWHVGNMHVMNPDGTGQRRIAFDQDHDWNPCVLNNGRVLYTRWEYTDIPHYFTRLLFHANPDGTGQMEYYGSNSYWPNSMYWPRPIPGHPTMVSCIVSGHHGVGRMGELVLLDPAKGRHEAEGVVQRIPGRGRKVEPIIEDGLVSESWPRFAAPYPLAEPETNRGAGRYFLVNHKQWPWSPWQVCLVDAFDNVTPIITGAYGTPIPLRPRFRPPVIPPRVNLASKTGTVYMADVYSGPGLAGVPRGLVKSLRIGSHHYRYGGNGDTYASSYEGGWDVKRILGTVPVEKDGSAFFDVPANTPLFVQPLDKDGKAVQTMRSWFSVMPGETQSCVGCHEKQNRLPPPKLNLAARKAPEKIRPWLGPTRGFGFDQDVQPVLDRRCVGCHGEGKGIDLRAKQLRKDYKGRYSPAYLALHGYVRRAGYESDYHMMKPAAYAANTASLVQMLKKGHHGTKLTDEEWQRLYTWIDFNIPYAPTWRQSHQPPADEQVARRAKYKRLYANLDDRDEDIRPAPPVATFQRPTGAMSKGQTATADGWPWTSEVAKQRQKALAKEELVLDLGDGVSMALVPVPAGQFVMGDARGYPDESRERAVTVSDWFHLAKFEVTNEQYARFDPEHDSGYIDGRGKDRTTRGYAINAPQQPVVRISWARARKFCDWLASRTGRTVDLPSEEQWEYACRAGTNTQWSFGQYNPKNVTMNIADERIRRWGWGRVETGYNDGTKFTAEVGRYTPNAWGLHDLHGNVAEWTRSDAVDAAGQKVVRGGSWNDTARHARSASRWRYPAWQPVYNVGFRIIVRP